MSKTSIAILGLALTLVAVPLAHADETKADCEQSVTWYDHYDPETGKFTGEHKGQQPWIGYTQTDSVRTFWYEAVDPDHKVNNCEGEHWDGQDSVQPGANNANGPECAVPAVDPAGNVAWCTAGDINNGGADPLSNGRVIGFRVSGKSGTNAAELYLAVDIALVGRTSAYQGACLTGGSGIEGAQSCNGTIGQSRTAWYGRDNTIGNVLATVISTTGITKGNASDADCNQTQYQSGAMQNNKQLCGRDNTAITLELLP